MSIIFIGEICRSCLLVRYVNHVYWWDMSIMFNGEICRLCLLVRYVDHVYWWDMSIMLICEICRSWLFVRYVDHVYWWDETQSCLLVRYFDHVYWWDNSIMFISEICGGGQSKFPSYPPPPSPNKRPRYPLNRRLSKHQSPRWDSNPSSSSQQRNHYTNCATRYHGGTAPGTPRPSLIEASRSHSDTPHTVELSGRAIAPPMRPLTNNTQQPNISCSRRN
jgi:hypothetical protein